MSLPLLNATALVCGSHIGNVDPLVDQHLFGLIHNLWRQRGRPCKNPGEIKVEDPKDIFAGVHNAIVGVVG